MITDKPNTEHGNGTNTMLGAGRNPFSKIMVEINGSVIVNIRDLPQEQYEAFLDLMHNLRMAYISIKGR